MTDRTMDSGPSRFGRDETDLDIDELFAASGDGGSEGETTDDNATTDRTGGRDEIEDTTAGELFEQLSEEVDDEAAETDPFDEFSDESPEEIIASADGAVEHVDDVDDAIAADDELFDTLLLPEREQADGFLWVQTDAEEGTDEGSEAADDAGGVGADQPNDSPAEDGFSFDAGDDEADPVAVDGEDGPPASGDGDDAADAGPSDAATETTPEVGEGTTLSATFGDGNTTDEPAVDGATPAEPGTAEPSDPVDETGGERDEEADGEAVDADPDPDDGTAPESDDPDDDSGGGRSITSKIRSILSG